MIRRFEPGSAILPMMAFNGHGSKTYPHALDQSLADRNIAPPSLNCNDYRQQNPGNGHLWQIIVLPTLRGKKRL